MAPSTASSSGPNESPYLRRPRVVARLPQPLRAHVFQNLPRRVVPGGAGDAAAGVRAGAAQVESADRRAVARPAGHRPTQEELPQVQVAVEDVPFRQTEPLLQV